MIFGSAVLWKGPPIKFRRFGWLGVKTGDNVRKPFGLLLLGAGYALRRDCLAAMGASLRLSVLGFGLRLAAKCLTATGASLRLSDWGFGLCLRRNCLTATVCGLCPDPQGTVSLDPILRKTYVSLFRGRVAPSAKLPYGNGRKPDELAFIEGRLAAAGIA